MANDSPKFQKSILVFCVHITVFDLDLLYRYTASFMT